METATASNHSIWAAMLLTTALLFSSSLAAKQTLNLAGDPWPPYISNDYATKGLLFELIESAFQTQGFKVAKHIYPTQRIYQMMLEAKVDGMIANWWSAEREQDRLYSAPYFVNTVYLYKHQDNRHMFRSIEDLVKRSVAVVDGYHYGEEFNRYAPQIETYQVSSSESGLKLAASGMIDFALAEDIVAEQHMRNHEISNLKMMELPLRVAEIHLVVSRKHAEGEQIIAAFNRGIEELVASGRYQQILRRYGLSSEKYLPERYR